MSAQPQRSGIPGFTVNENLNMSPIDKHIHYNKFSWRLIYNIILVVLVTAQVLIIFDNDASYSREEQRTFRNLFMNSTNDDDHKPVLEFSTPDTLLGHFVSVQEILVNLDDNMFQPVGVENATIRMHIQRHFGPPEFKISSLADGFPTLAGFNLTNMEAFKTFLQNTVELEIIAKGIRVFNQKDTRNKRFCQDWEVTLTYDARRLSRIYLTVSSQSSLCGISNDDVESTHISISFLVIIFAVLSLLLSVQKIKSISMMFVRLKAGYNNYAGTQYKAGLDRPESEPLPEPESEIVDEDGEAESPRTRQRMKTLINYNTWEDIPFISKARLLSPWFFFTTVGNIFQLISSISIILAFFLPGVPQSFYNANTSIGFSVWISWIGTLQYLRYWKDIILITSTLSQTKSTIAIYFGIVAPIFMGACILGYSLFWRYDKFNSLSMTARTLFSMSGGDIVHEAFLDTWDEGVIGNMFLMTFMVMFYTAFINILVAVIMEGYDRGRMMKRIEHDDPFKDQYKKTNVGNVKMFGLDEDDEPVNASVMSSSGYNLRDKIKKKMSNDLDVSVKNVLSTLLNQQEQAKARVAQMIKIRRALITSGHGRDIVYETSIQFITDTISNSFNRILNYIFYLRSLLKKPIKSKDE